MTGIRLCGILNNNKTKKLKLRSGSADHQKDRHGMVNMYFLRKSCATFLWKLGLRHSRRCNSGRPYPAADLTKGKSPCEKFYGCTQCKAARGTPICRACKCWRFFALLTGKSSHPFYMVSMFDGDAHPRLMLLTGKSSHPRRILLGGKSSCFLYLSGSYAHPCQTCLWLANFAWYAYPFYTLFTCICYDNGRERSTGVLNP